VRFLSGFWGLAVFAGAVVAAPLAVPFDFSRSALEVKTEVGGTPLTMILDTGVDPSVIDLKTAEALHMPLARGDGGEVSGEGDAQSATAYPAVQNGLALGGKVFAPFETLATDMATLSAQYGKPLHGVLGYSFLRDKIVLIDYPARQLVFMERPMEVLFSVQSCRLRHSLALKSFEGDSIPVISGFRFGVATAPISLDTGATGGISLYQAALALPGVKEALKEKGEIVFAGARGKASAKTYGLNAPVGFGPFTLPPGQTVSLRKPEGSMETRVANIGNALFSAMKLKILLDYKARVMTFYGDCR